VGRLPSLHYIDERPDRNSTNRLRNFPAAASQFPPSRPDNGEFVLVRIFRDTPGVLNKENVLKHFDRVSVFVFQEEQPP